MTFLEALIKSIRIEYIKWGIYVCVILLAIFFLIMAIKKIKNIIKIRKSIINCEIEFSTSDIVNENAAKTYILTHRKILEEDDIKDNLKSNFKFDNKKSDLFISKYY